MSDPAPEEAEHTVTVDDITVTKTFTPDDLPVPAVRFLIESHRDSPARVRVSETIPATFSMNSVGFHPDYDAEHWTAYQDKHVVYEREIAAGDTVETVYGIRVEDTEEASAFLTDPEVTVVGAENGPIGRTGMPEGALSDIEEPSIESIAPPEETEAVKEMIAEAEAELATDADETGTDHTTSLTAAETTSEGDESQPSSTPSEPELVSPTTEEPPAPSVSPESGTHETSQADNQDVEAQATESVTTALVNEIEAGEVSEDELTALREALDVTTTNSVDARINHLQSRVEEVAAYRKAMAELLDQQGEEGQFFPEVHAEVETLAADVEDLQTVAGDIESLEKRIETLESTVDDLDTIEADLHAVEEELSALDETVTEIQTTVGEIDTDRDFEAVADQLADLTTTLETLETELADVKENVETTRKDVTEIQQWRQRLGEMFQ